MRPPALLATSGTREVEVQVQVLARPSRGQQEEVTGLRKVTCVSSSTGGKEELRAQSWKEFYPTPPVLAPG